MAETNLNQLLKTMQPVLNDGEYVFCVVQNVADIDIKKLLFYFTEKEGITIIVNKNYADEKGFAYQYVAAWISLNVFSSLEATGLTAAFSTALYNNDISCNVVAAYHHDHIFVAVNDRLKAIEVLQALSASARI